MYTAEEQAENRAKWVEALRSGNYRQGRFALRPSNSEFCCLGVACDISKQGHWETSSNANRGYVIPPDYSAYNRGSLPTEVMKWLGLDSEMGIFTEAIKTKDNHHCASLTDFNDTQGATFNDIADVIEAGYTKLKGA